MANQNDAAKRMAELRNTLTFGVELELVNISVGAATRALAELFNRAYCDSGYAGAHAWDGEGRKWKVVRDGSLHDRSGRGSAEVVSPPLRLGEDMDTLQQVVRALRAAGAEANESCGIHVHVDGAPFIADTSKLRNMILLASRKEDLMMEALGVAPTRLHTYCRRQSAGLVRRARNGARSLEQMERAWYATSNDGRGHATGIHYDPSRYHWVNLHNLWYRPANGEHPTVEFRLFNGTTHAGKVRAYVNLCLSLAARALSRSTIQTKERASWQWESREAEWDNFLRKALLLHRKDDACIRQYLSAGFAPESQERRAAIQRDNEAERTRREREAQRIATMRRRRGYDSETRRALGMTDAEASAMMTDADLYG